MGVHISIFYSCLKCGSAKQILGAELFILLVVLYYYAMFQLVMDAVLEIMYKAVVPWNDTIEKLVQQRLEKEHPK